MNEESDEGVWGVDKFVVDSMRGIDGEGDGSPEKPLKTLAAVRNKIEALQVAGYVFRFGTTVTVMSFSPFRRTRA